MMVRAVAMIVNCNRKRGIQKRAQVMEINWNKVASFPVTLGRTSTRLTNRVSAVKPKARTKSRPITAHGNHSGKLQGQPETANATNAAADKPLSAIGSRM